ncbi:hypothetical protein HYQ46_005718 [Verticillium longisporum]|nr:hypothetical protein HYQ46_005718 [Verticillium longisporum]
MVIQHVKEGQTSFELDWGGQWLCCHQRHGSKNGSTNDVASGDSERPLAPMLKRLRHGTVSMTNPVTVPAPCCDEGGAEETI